MGDSPTPAALPFYKSPLFLLIVTAFLTKVIAAFPGVVGWVGLSDSNLNVYVTGISLGIGGLAELIALRLRANSKLQPLTTTQGAADKIVKSNPTPVEILKPPSSGVPPSAWVVFVLCALPIITQIPACMSLSFQERLAAAYGTYTTVERAADQAYVSGALPKPQAQAARDLAKQVRPFLDAAQAATTAGDDAGAANDLVLAQKSLQALQAYVNAQLAKEKK